MKTEYNGIEITYDEGRDQWLFELRGRSRWTELDKAIDAASNVSAATTDSLTTKEKPCS